MKNSILSLSCTFLLTLSAAASCPENTDLIVVGDSQTGATWSRTYFGDYLQQCLGGDFKIYGQGGSVARIWTDNRGLQDIEIVERSPEISHEIIGKRKSAPSCKKNLDSMLSTHKPKSVLYFFGDNYIASSSKSIAAETDKLISKTMNAGIKAKDCYFLTPSYEMEVSTRRNVSRKYLKNTQRIRDAIIAGIKGRCQVLDGIELMQDSKFFDGVDKLKRVRIPGDAGCTGAAKNDNIHICGEAAKDLALKVCDRL